VDYFPITEIKTIPAKIIVSYEQNFTGKYEAIYRLFFYFSWCNNP